MLRCLLSGRPLSRVLSGTYSRNLAYWNIEWKPAPYPCTAAQREAAAKRYGLLLTDYQPFEDDGYAPGDYPDMKNFNEANRDPWEHYDYYPVKRNYNEPVPFYWEFYSEAGADPDFQEVHHYGQPMWWVFFKFLLPPILVGGFALLLEPYSFFQPEKAKQFPFCKKDEHYTFEPEV